VRSSASSFKREYTLLSLRSASSFLRLLPRLPVTSISPFSQRKHIAYMISLFLERDYPGEVTMWQFFHLLSTSQHNSFKALWSRLLLYELEPSRASFALWFAGTIYMKLNSGLRIDILIIFKLYHWAKCVKIVLPRMPACTRTVV
jgi:hypothetical protein